MNIYLLGSGVGTDAGGWQWTPHGWKRVPGWNPEATLELSHALNVIKLARQFKTPQLMDATVKAVMDFSQKELSTYVKDGGVVLI